jgi:hypothetical protein
MVWKYVAMGIRSCSAFRRSSIRFRLATLTLATNLAQRKRRRLTGSFRNHRRWAPRTSMATSHTAEDFTSEKRRQRELDLLGPDIEPGADPVELGGGGRFAERGEQR